MGVATKTRMTEDEFLRMPDDGRKWELVNGEPKEVPTGFYYEVISVTVGCLLYPHGKGKGAMCSSGAGFRMANGNIRCPDVSFTRKERFPGGQVPIGFGDSAPDLCIEIISPSEEFDEMMKKVREYFGAGAEQVWHLFPETQTARVYHSPIEFVDYAPQDEITGGDILPDFRSIVSELFVIE